MRETIRFHYQPLNNSVNSSSINTDGAKSKWSCSRKTLYLHECVAGVVEKHVLVELMLEWVLILTSIKRPATTRNSANFVINTVQPFAFFFFCPFPSNFYKTCVAFTLITWVHSHDQHWAQNSSLAVTLLSSSFLIRIYLNYIILTVSVRKSWSCHSCFINL